MPLSGPVHTLAIVSVVVLFLGACGLARRMAARDRMAFAGIVTYGFACVAIMIAGAVSGFAVPGIVKHMQRDTPSMSQQWRIVIDGIFQINQAFARIYSVAASIAIVLWCVSAMRNGEFSRGIAIYGCVVAPLIIAGVGLNHLRLDVHGMGMVALGQATWFILVGCQMCSQIERRSST